MRFLIHAARKDLRLRLADPVALAIWLGIPLLVGGLISLVAGGSGGPSPTAKVLLVDQDDTLLSGLLANLGGAGDLGEMLDVEKVPLDEGQARIEAGHGSALLIVPAGFADAVINNRPATLKLVTNPTQTIMPAIIEEALEMLVEAGFYVQRVFGPEIKQIAGDSPGDAGGGADAQVAAISVAVHGKVQALGTMLAPPVLGLSTEVVGKKSAMSGMNLGALFLPTMLFMAVLFIAQGTSDDVWKEKEQGTLRRLASAPQATTWMLAGKLVATAVLMAAVALAGAVVAVAAFGVSWTRLLPAALWATFVGTALQSLFVLVQMLAANQRAGSVLSTAVMFPLMMVGGCFFPFEAMPDWLTAIGKWTPNGIGVLRLKEILFGAPSPGGFLVAVLILGVTAALAIAVAARRLRGSFATG